ncbi:hypothetical protein VNI00_006104 [Paramarasmius palmivorus]|uniref:Uncharacterized protein n=1 Tax=Paramarasmius palmivorus TaxID=297713 RepID=A0AAW0DA86_9AGAR
MVPPNKCENIAAEQDEQQIMDTSSSKQDDVLDERAASVPEQEEKNSAGPVTDNDLVCDEHVLTIAEQDTYIRCLCTTLRIVQTHAHFAKLQKDQLQRENEELMRRNAMLEGALRSLSSLNLLSIPQTQG